MNIDLTRPPGPLRRLGRVFAEAPTTAATLTMYRCTEAGRSPTDASRSATYAGRWHHPADSLALYTADDADLSVAEWARARRGRVLFALGALAGGSAGDSTL